MILAYSWTRPCYPVAGNGRRGMFLFLLFLHFHSCSSFLSVPLSCLFSFISSTISSISFLPFSGRRHNDTKWTTRVGVSLNTPPPPPTPPPPKKKKKKKKKQKKKNIFPAYSQRQSTNVSHTILSREKLLSLPVCFPVHQLPFEKESILNRKSLLPKGSKVFPTRVDLFSKGNKQFW